MKKIILFFLIIFLNLFIFSHPHMFIDSQISFEFSESKLKGFWVTWYFDQMFSEGILMDYDLDNDLKFNSDETLSVEMGAFANLENYNYFLFVNYKGKESKINSVENFTVFYKDNRLVYTFFVPVQFYLGKTSRFEAVRAIGVEVLWLFGLYVVIRVVWKRGLRKYESVGI